MDFQGIAPENQWLPMIQFGSISNCHRLPPLPPSRCKSGDCLFRDFWWENSSDVAQAFLSISDARLKRGSGVRLGCDSVLHPVYVGGAHGSWVLLAEFYGQMKNPGFSLVLFLKMPKPLQWVPSFSAVGRHLIWSSGSPWEAISMTWWKGWSSSRCLALLAGNLQIVSSAMMLCAAVQCARIQSWDIWTQFRNPIPISNIFKYQLVISGQTWQWKMARFFFFFEPVFPRSICEPWDLSHSFSHSKLKISGEFLWIWRGDPPDSSHVFMEWIDIAHR